TRLRLLATAAAHRDWRKAFTRRHRNRRVLCTEFSRLQMVTTAGIRVPAWIRCRPFRRPLVADVARRFGSFAPLDTVQEITARSIPRTASYGALQRRPP